MGEQNSAAGEVSAPLPTAAHGFGESAEQRQAANLRGTGRRSGADRLPRPALQQNPGQEIW